MEDGELRIDWVTLPGGTKRAPIYTWLEDSRWQWKAGDGLRGTASSRYFAQVHAGQAVRRQVAESEGTVCR
jgi:hypothetical protein